MRSLLLRFVVDAQVRVRETLAVPSQAEPTPEPFVAESGERITILPRPNSGQAPQSPGDPGGWMQLLLLGAICQAIVAIALLVWREARRSS